MAAGSEAAAVARGSVVADWVAALVGKGWVAVAAPGWAVEGWVDLAALVAEDWAATAA